MQGKKILRAETTDAGSISGAIHGRHSSLAILLRWLTPPALTLVLYWPALGLPFFWDDVANFRFMEGLSLLEIWTSSDNFPYYRPLGFSVWRAWGWLFGQTNTVAFHTLNLLALTANGWLMGALATRLVRAGDHSQRAELSSDWHGWIAGALLTAFPFAALVVPLVASMFHLLVTMLALIAAVSLFEYQKTKSWGWATLCVACAALAPFVHESGVATGAVLVALWVVICSSPLNETKTSSFVNLWGKVTRETGGALIILSLLLNLLFIPLWAAIPKSRAVSGLPQIRPPSEILHNALFFLEAFTFPLQHLALRLGWSEEVSVMAIGVLGVSTVASIMLRFGRTHWLIAATMYSLAASLPSILTLQKLYVVVSPRLTFFPAPGAVLLWCGVSTTVASLAHRHMRRNVVGPAMAAGMLALILANPCQYVWSRVQLHVRALEPVWGMVNAIQTYPNERHLVVNPTTWLASAKFTYPIVHDGVVVIPEYINPAQLASVHTRLQHTLDGVNFPLVATEPDYHYYDVWGEVLHWEAMASKVRRYDHVWLVTYGDGPLGFYEVGQVRTIGTQPVPFNPAASFDAGRVLLEQASARLTEHGIKIVLDWHMKQHSTETVFAHAFDCDSNMLGMADGAPLGRMFPMWLWQPGEAVRDVRTVSLSTESNTNCYQIEVGLYDPTSGIRTAATGRNGQPLPNDVLYWRMMGDGRDYLENGTHQD